jgi:hypothetical protein
MRRKKMAELCSDYDAEAALRAGPRGRAIVLTSAAMRMNEILFFKFFRELRDAQQGLAGCFKLIDVLASFSSWDAADGKRLLVKVFQTPWMKGSVKEFLTLYLRLNGGNRMSSAYKTLKIKARDYREVVRQEQSFPMAYPPKIRDQDSQALIFNVMASLEAFDCMGVSVYRRRPKRLYLASLGFVRDHYVMNRAAATGVLKDRRFKDGEFQRIRDHVPSVLAHGFGSAHYDALRSFVEGASERAGMRGAGEVEGVFARPQDRAVRALRAGNIKTKGLKHPHRGLGGLQLRGQGPADKRASGDGGGLQEDGAGLRVHLRPAEPEPGAVGGREVPAGG